MLDDPPCFRSWQLRVSEKNKVSLRIIMRSSDCGNAYAANLGAFIRVFTDLVINPAGGKLEEIIFIAFSEHLYEGDMSMVEALIGKIPAHIKAGMIA
jgi:thymidylate synthase